MQPDGREPIASSKARLQRHPIGVAFAALVFLGLIAVILTLVGVWPAQKHDPQASGSASYQSGRRLSASDAKAALAQRQKVLEDRERIVVRDPESPQALFGLATAHYELAETYENLREPAEALEHARAAADLFKESLGLDRNNAVYQRNLGLAYERLGSALVLAAKDETQSRETRVENLNQARRAYFRSRELFTALRDRGALMPSDSHQIGKFTDKIAETDKEIARLSR